MSAREDLLRLGFEAVAAAPSRKSAAHGEAGYERRRFDAYFTEPWVTRALIAAVELAPPGRTRAATIVWEPACGDGRMALQLIAAGYQVVATDIAHDWGYGVTGIDFLDPASAAVGAACDAIVTNPPFGDDAVRFIARALMLTEPRRGKVAILQRHDFDAASGRHPLFDRHPFRAKLVLPRRPRWSDEPETAAPRFPYAWYLWDWAAPGPGPTLYLPDPDATPPAVGRLL